MAGNQVFGLGLSDSRNFASKRGLLVRVSMLAQGLFGVPGRNFALQKTYLSGSSSGASGSSR